MGWLREQHAEGKPSNHIRRNGGGLLTLAVRNNRKDALELLLGCGFDPNERVAGGKGDWTAYSQGYPLWYCAALGYREMAETLLDRSAVQTFM